MARWTRSAERRAAQTGGVARLEAESGGVAGDVRPVLVDDRRSTPRGTRTRSTRRPFGRTRPSTTSPTGSARVATWRSPSAMAVDPGLGRAQRSSVGGRRPPSARRPARGRPLPPGVSARCCRAGQRPDARAVSLRAPEDGRDHRGGRVGTRRASSGTGVGHVAGRTCSVRPERRGRPDGRRSLGHDRRASHSSPTGARRGAHRVTQALGEHHAVGADDLDGVVGVEVTRRPTTRRRAAADASALDAGPAGAVVDHQGARRRRRRRRSTACGREAGAGRAGRRCRPRPRRPTTRASTPGRPASAMTVSTPDHVAILAAANFEAMPPLPTVLPGPPAIISSRWSISTTSSMSEASAVVRRIGGEQAGGVGQQDQERRPPPGAPPARPAGRCRRNGSPRRRRRRSRSPPAPRRARGGGPGSGGRAGTAGGGRSRAVPTGPGPPGDRGRPRPSMPRVRA